MAAPGNPANIVPADESTLMRRLEQIERDIRELGPSIAKSFASTVADLQAQQAAILALVNTQLVPDFGFATASNYSIPAGFGSKVTRASYTHTVPAGYTKALIVASAQDAAVNSTAGLDYLSSYVQIASGYYAYASSATIPAGYTGASFASITQLLTGLTGGATITVISQPHSFTGSFAVNTVNSTVLSGTCLFLR